MTQQSPVQDSYHTVRAIHLATGAFGSGLAFGPWDLILWRIVGGLGVLGNFAILSFVFVLKFVRETKGRQLQDME